MPIMDLYMAFKLTILLWLQALQKVCRQQAEVTQKH
jgi:hypothetical protein